MSVVHSRQETNMLTQLNEYIDTEKSFSANYVAIEMLIKEGKVSLEKDMYPFERSLPKDIDNEK